MIAEGCERLLTAKVYLRTMFTNTRHEQRMFPLPFPSATTFFFAEGCLLQLLEPSLLVITHHYQSFLLGG